MTEFILGCNYWASNAGTEMWNNWDETVIKNDLEILSSNGVKYLRVFPNWRDFQPVIPLLVNNCDVFEYTLKDDKQPLNKYYLDEDMLYRFNRFCDICSDYNLKVIVGLLTGWMSGRIFIPPALIGKNLYSDSEALYFEQLFVKGFVKRFKDKDAIFAWDHGNECCCLGQAESYEQASAWTMMISNAIYSQDKKRLVISGIHELSADRYGIWTIEAQSENVDILATHPYPFWSKYAACDKNTSIRTLLYPVFMSKYYREIGKKPCLVEEIGTMGPSVCSDNVSESFLKVILFTSWSNKFEGVLWWCANEQTNLNTAPYTWNMCETELGLIDANRKTKPVLKCMKEFSEVLKTVNLELSEPKKDALCISQFGQDSMGVSFMSYVLSRQAGINPEFCFCNDELPDYSVYMIPSYKGTTIMNLNTYKELKRRVYNGADLYISYDGGILSEFEELTGLRIENAYSSHKTISFEILDEKIVGETHRCLDIVPISAEILVNDDEGNPIITKNEYGKGNVYFVNFPVESMLLNKDNAFEKDISSIYKFIFKKITDSQPIKIKNNNVLMTYHYEKDKIYSVITNYSDTVQKVDLDIRDKYYIKKVHIGDLDCCKPFDTAVVEFGVQKKSYNFVMR